VGAELAARAHRVTGVDSSPRLVELARERHPAVVADAAALPFPDASFDLVVAYMSLMNLDELDAAVAEAARVLEPGGRICASLLHPVFAAGSWAAEGADAPFVIAGSYYGGPAKIWTSDRDGIVMTFHDRPLPLEAYVRALEAAGLLLERVREPVPDDTYVRDAPSAARLRRIPLFLHLRAVKLGAWHLHEGARHLNN
jgi:SAM-dependent methyltransferase